MALAAAAALSALRGARELDAALRLWAVKRAPFPITAPSDPRWRSRGAINGPAFMLDHGDVERRKASTQGNLSGRPRLVFFRINRDNLPIFIKGHFDDHVRCLQSFFDVVLIEENCDYDAVCDQFRPEIALFESGVYTRPNRRISNTHRHPAIPKIGLINADAYCLSRSLFFSDMDEWGIDKFFTISMSLPSRVPHLGDRLFVWPNFADARRFRMYPGGKQTPILFAGSMAPHYPWRNRVNYLLQKRDFDVALLPHGGWFDRDKTRNMLSGDAYAQALSSSFIVPTCGTIAHELVRKHLEIPACGALLLTERTAAVEAAGFVDMETCVFADENDVVDKVEYLLSHPEQMERISVAGQNLAHTRHDIACRNQIFQWYELTKRAAPGDRIIQPDPFGEMVLQKSEPHAAPVPDLVVGRDSVLIDTADRALSSGSLGKARAAYQAVLNYHYEAEAAVGMARISLRSGDAALAKEWVWGSIARCIRLGAAEPDPVELSVYVLSLLCAGRLRAAALAARYYEPLTHPELTRVRHLLRRLTGVHSARAPDRLRFSIHRDRNLSWAEWIDDIAQMLRACGQVETAKLAIAMANDLEPVESLSLREDERPRRLGRQFWSTKYHRRPRLGLRKFIPTIRRARAVEPGNPVAEMLAGRGISTMILAGLPPGDRLEELLRHTCRHSPESCTLITIGDLSDSGGSAGRSVERGSDALGDGKSLEVNLVERSVVVVGPAAAELISLGACSGAELIILTHSSERSILALAAKLDSEPGWKRVPLLTAAAALGIVAWEAVCPPSVPRSRRGSER